MITLRISFDDILRENKKLVNVWYTIYKTIDEGDTAALQTNDRDFWLDWAMELQAIAQNGLAYTKDIYDKERFERIREISAEIISKKADYA